MITIIVKLPDELIERLEAQAKKKNISVDELVLEALKTYLDNDDVDPTTEHDQNQ